MAGDLAVAGVRRINVSIDTLDPEKFRRVTRWGDLDKVLMGLEAAKEAGLDVKVNAVALRGENDDELGDMLAWCGKQGFDMTIIEVMPMGDIGTENRLDQYLPLSRVRSTLARRFTLTDIPFRTGGPARYVRVEETGHKLGFITPLTHNFCESCNRVRLHAPDNSICALVRTIMLTYALLCARVGLKRLMPPFPRRLVASQKAMTSSSTGASQDQLLAGI